MTTQFIDPQTAVKLLEEGALLMDIRSADEYARKHIQGAKLNGQVSLPKNACIIYCCASGIRTQNQAGYLKKCAKDCAQVYFLEGGLNAWEKAGLPIEENPKQPLELMRQVQIVAGSLVVLGVVLGTLLTPAFYLLSAFVGAGLIFAGISGFCGMAKLLMLMPWNRVNDTH